MELLRWILLGAGLVFVLIIYLVGRKRRTNQNATSEHDSEDLPEFSANNWSDDDILTDVVITARTPDDVYSEAPADTDDYFYDDDLGDTAEDSGEIQGDDFSSDLTRDLDQIDTQQQTELAPEIIVLTIIAKTDLGLRGDKINSAALANKLTFGYMNIFHRMGENAQPAFSMANLVEPGSFDPDTIHDLKTPGLTLFLQLPVYGNASAILAEMLECAYKIAEILGADLCNKRRELLTEKEAEAFRELAKAYD